MPELPEVETTRRGIVTHLKRQQIKRIWVRQAKLRWPIPKDLAKQAKAAWILDVTRRGKYLFIVTNRGTVIIHLGMSGSLRILSKPIPHGKHDHVDLILENTKILRFTDPRRFGAWLWTTTNPHLHLLVKNLGPEPFTKEFSGDYLFNITRSRRTSVKQLIMDHHVVVGVGNIYANEALFLAAIHPATPASSLNKKQCAILVKHIQAILKRAIKVGGTTIRNFSHGENEGNPGYFKQQLWVYGRAHQPCKKCGNSLKEQRIGQRSSVFCTSCQK